MSFGQYSNFLSEILMLNLKVKISLQQSFRHTMLHHYIQAVAYDR